MFVAPLAARRRAWLACCVVLAALSGPVACRFPESPPADQVQGSGVAKTEQRTVSAFSQVEVGAAVKLELTVGKDASLEVTADDNLLEHLVTEVKNDTLKIYVKGSTSTKIGMTARATTPALKGVTSSGAAQATVKDVKADAFQLKAEGASHCNVEGQLGGLTATGLGAAQVTVAGLKGGKIKVGVEGASQCTLRGEAERVEITATGAAHVHAGELAAQVVQVDASGAAQVEVKAAKELTAKASGAAAVHYAGSPTVKMDVSGAGSVKPK